MSSSLGRGWRPTDPPEDPAPRTEDRGLEEGSVQTEDGGRRTVQYRIEDWRTEDWGWQGSTGDIEGLGTCHMKECMLQNR